MSRRTRTWSELLATPLGSDVSLGPEAPLTPLRTVTMPSNGLRMTPEALVAIILAQIDDNDMDLISEPSSELVASWKQSQAVRLE